jgi:hypothetical protein
MRLLSRLLAVALTLAGGSAFAQGGGLAGVTMRVVDDLSGIDAVVLELAPRGAEPAEEAEAVEPPEADERDDSRRQEESAERPVPQPQAQP